MKQIIADEILKIVQDGAFSSPEEYIEYLIYKDLNPGKHTFNDVKNHFDDIIIRFRKNYGDKISLKQLSLYLLKDYELKAMEVEKVIHALKENHYITDTQNTKVTIQLPHYA